MEVFWSYISVFDKNISRILVIRVPCCENMIMVWLGGGVVVVIHESAPSLGNLAGVNSRLPLTYF
jgi:hypothetical protein